MRTRARMYETNDIDTPWMIYQVHSGYSLPTYVEFQPMNSLSEIDDALERNAKARRPGGANPLAAQKWIREADLNIDIQIYRVSQSMSHFSALDAAGAGSAKRDRASAARGRSYTLPAQPRIEFPGIPKEKNNKRRETCSVKVRQCGKVD